MERVGLGDTVGGDCPSGRRGVVRFVLVTRRSPAGPGQVDRVAGLIGVVGGEDHAGGLGSRRGRVVADRERGRLAHRQCPPAQASWQRKRRTPRDGQARESQGAGPLVANADLPAHGSPHGGASQVDSPSTCDRGPTCEHPHLPLADPAHRQEGVHPACPVLVVPARRVVVDGGRRTNQLGGVHQQPAHLGGGETDSQILRPAQDEGTDPRCQGGR